MLHTKFHGYRLTDGGDDFRKVFTILRCGSHLGHDHDSHMGKISQTIFQCHYPRKLHIKFQQDWR